MNGNYLVIISQFEIRKFRDFETYISNDFLQPYVGEIYIICVCLNSQHGLS